VTAGPVPFDPSRPERPVPRSEPRELSQVRHAGGVARRVAIALALTLAGLLALYLIGYDVGAVALLIGLMLAVLPVPIYVALGLWIDRFEPEPVWMIAITFFWGATGAVLLALIINSVGEMIVTQELGREAGVVFSGSISAPVVEESAKALVLLVIFRRKREEFNGILDGIVYATMVGLGFAMTENVLYYGQGTAEAGAVGAVSTFVGRGLLSPFAHPLFTSMTGIGFGIAAHSPRRSVRVAAPLLGLGAAMLLHAVWNTASAEGLFLGVYFLLMLPLFAAVIVVAYAARRREGRVIREQLAPEVARGEMSQDEVDALASIRERRRAARWVRARAGRAALRLLKRYQLVATELAFHRQRLGRGLAPWDGSTADQEERYLSELSELRSRLALAAR
jgi:protease PrsW